jgi:hypothetical protein
VSDVIADRFPAAPPAASGPAGPRFEGKVGAFYFLALLGSGEPRGLPGATVRAVRFQQSPHGRPLDDVTIDAINADGSDAFLDIQAKRTINFTAGDANFADVVRRLWATSQNQRFVSARYEMAVAVARTSTRIERDCQQVLQWASHLTSAESFARHMALEGFASNGMRNFLAAFQHHLISSGGPDDDETVWCLLRRFKILVFDFEAPGSDYDHRAREQARTVLARDQASRAADLWSILTDEALAIDATGGETNRANLIGNLGQKHGFLFGERPDLRPLLRRLVEAADHALADINDNIGGARLSRAELIESAEAKLDVSRIVQITGASGVGKSAVLKALALDRRAQGTVIVLAPGRIPKGGWTSMVQAVGCPVGRDELLNELGCAGGAVLFVDNIDQIDDAETWLTLRDLLRGVRECQGWRVVCTARSDNQEWRANLPAELQQEEFATVRVEGISDAEANVLRTQNPTLLALLANDHPARAMARNPFYLSRLRDFAIAENAALQLANELDLARAWWRFGGGRSETGKFERLKLLRNLGMRAIGEPGLAAFPADELDSKTIEQLLRVETLREDRAGATVAFWHDTLRDWTVGFLLDEQPDLLETLPMERPLPGALARGLEIAARLRLETDPTGDRWLRLLAVFEAATCHGSWRRPILLALPRSENAILLFEQVKGALIADRGRRLKEIIQLMISVETTPLTDLLARIPNATQISNAVASRTAIPSTSSWLSVIAWVALRADVLPSAIIPEAAKLFQLWLMVTRGQTIDINRLIVYRLFEWLSRLEEARRPTVIHDIREARRLDLDFERLHAVHEDIRLTFLAFCDLNPNAAERYLRETDTKHHDARGILNISSAAAKAVPAALADFALKLLIPGDDDEDNLYRSRRDRFGPFGVFDIDFITASPGQGPFFALLEESREDGLRVVRGIVEHATQWYREWSAEEGSDFPNLTIPFPNTAKSFAGGFGIYQWSRGGTGAVVAASALMALEAWAHRQVEGGRPVDEVVDDVLGPSGSSVAFVCVAVDVVLSHWQAMKGLAWPMLAVPELLKWDHMRHTQDVSGLGRFLAPEREQDHWPVKTADLMARPSRRVELIDKIGDYALNGPAQLHAMLRDALVSARDRVIAVANPDDGDQILGLRATAERALRMSDAAHWQPVTIRLQDGQEIAGHQYQIPVEEIARRNMAVGESNARLVETNTRLSLQRALMEPTTSTQQIVAEGISWANAQVAENEGARTEEEDTFEQRWKARAVAMAAALALRDYEGPDRSEIEAWSRPILLAATAEDDDLASRTGDQIWSNRAAIATIGYVGLYRRTRDVAARDALLALAARQNHPILHAIGGSYRELTAFDGRLVRSLIRLAIQSAIHPRHTLEPDEDAALLAAHRQKIDEAIETERRWLDDKSAEAEPDWPAIAPWYSPRRRRTWIGHYRVEEESQTPSALPEMHVDEHALGILAGCLVPLTLGTVPEWLIALAQHFMGWSIEANNGPPGDDEEERENRPFSWNLGFFDFLGILCAAMPFERANSLLIGPMISLHDDAFHDAMAAFLRGFDRATFATDTPEPENPVAVRFIFVERLRRSRTMRSLAYRESFSAETHLGDALNALFYQPSNWMNRGRAYVPERWNGLHRIMPFLVPLVTSTPQSGYLAVVFLTAMEACPCGALLGCMLEAMSAWRSVHAAGTNFWSEHQVGHRICEWIDRTFSGGDSTSKEALPYVQDELGKCLDILVQSGIASARALESRIISDGVSKRIA